MNIIQLLCRNSTSPYQTQANLITERGIHFCAHDQVGEIAAILSALAKDAHAGLVASIADQARAETFDDFLDHAEFYAKSAKRNEAGVLAGVVFEDSIRRVCRKNGLDEKGVAIDQLVSSLVKAGVLSETKAKRARAAAHVRTKATHAQWDEFDLSDVKSCIEFTRGILERELDA